MAVPVTGVEGDKARLRADGVNPWIWAWRITGGWDGVLAGVVGRAARKSGYLGELTKSWCCDRWVRTSLGRKRGRGG